MLQLLGEFDCAQAHDDRDRLFAIYGFAEDLYFDDSGPRRKYSIQAFDYEGSTKDIFCRFAARCVEANPVKELFLHTSAFGSLQEKYPDVPSWVPDWSRARRESHNFLWFEEEH
jgi:hypothetical protein